MSVVSKWSGIKGSVHISQTTAAMKNSYSSLNKPFANDEEKCYVLRRLRRRKRRPDPNAPSLAERIFRERRKEAELDENSHYIGQYGGVYDHRYRRRVEPTDQEQHVHTNGGFHQSTEMHSNDTNGPVSNGVYNRSTTRPSTATNDREKVKDHRRIKSAGITRIRGPCRVAPMQNSEETTERRSYTNHVAHHVDEQPRPNTPILLVNGHADYEERVDRVNQSETRTELRVSTRGDRAEVLDVREDETDVDMVSRVESKEVREERMDILIDSEELIVSSDNSTLVVEENNVVHSSDSKITLLDSEVGESTTDTVKVVKVVESEESNISVIESNNVVAAAVILNSEKDTKTINQDEKMQVSVEETKINVDVEKSEVKEDANIVLTVKDENIVKEEDKTVITIEKDNSVSVEKNVSNEKSVVNIDKEETSIEKEKEVKVNIETKESAAVNIAVNKDSSVQNIEVQSKEERVISSTKTESKEEETSKVEEKSVEDYDLKSASVDIDIEVESSKEEVKEDTEVKVEVAASLSIERSATAMSMARMDQDLDQIVSASVDMERSDTTIEEIKSIPVKPAFQADDKPEIAPDKPEETPDAPTVNSPSDAKPEAPSPESQSEPEPAAKKPVKPLKKPNKPTLNHEQVRKKIADLEKELEQNFKNLGGDDNKELTEQEEEEERKKNADFMDKIMNGELDKNDNDDLLAEFMN